MPSSPLTRSVISLRIIAFLVTSCTRRMSYALLQDEPRSTACPARTPRNAESVAKERGSHAGAASPPSWPSMIKMCGRGATLPGMPSSAWTRHLAAYKKSHPSKSMKECMIEASACYTSRGAERKREATYRASSADSSALDRASSADLSASDADSTIRDLRSRIEALEKSETLLRQRMQKAEISIRAHREIMQNSGNIYPGTKRDEQMIINNMSNEIHRGVGSTLT